MKRFAALAVALADNYNVPSLEQIFDQYEETIVHGD